MPDSAMPSLDPDALEAASPLARMKAKYQPMRDLDEILGFERDDTGTVVRFYPLPKDER